MAQWQLKIDLSTEHKAYEDDTITEDKLGPLVATKLKEFRPEVEKAKFAGESYQGVTTILEMFDEITQAFSEADDIELYDQALEDLYDWGDFELDNDTVWGKKVAWIDTIGLSTRPTLPS